MILENLIRAFGKGKEVLGAESGLEDMDTQFNTAGNGQLPFHPRPLHHVSPINIKTNPTISFIQKIVSPEKCVFIE
ncbi:hypothetical protein BELL_0244g00110 [Botrytis elliptica]|uniref:Uncharacterized protein n=1 Tax=Botrytis elliptica TaxID=278938 RepID=A0A4Z1JND1_9HELO|nr:hypothetical protein EAE99_006684 [Botrytis elliptica]TGO74966.1 hypothetical protein BELL_0244g00110 [Botrytis elliptica]